MADVLSFRDITGRVLTLSAPLRVSQYAGFGPPAPRLLTQRDVYRSGQRTQHTAWEARVIQLTIELTPEAGQDTSELRDALGDLLAHLATGLWLVYTRDDGRAYETLVRLGAEVPMARLGTQGSRWQRVVLTLVADEPWWLGPPEVWVFAVGGGTGAWGFPVGFPEGLGGSIADLTETRQYTGQADAYPVIRVLGPAKNITIENLTLGTVLALPTYDVAPGETLTIDLREDYKTITSDATPGSLLSYLTEESHLGTWRLGAHPVPPGGQNTLRVHMEDGAGTTQLSVHFRPRFINA